MKFCVRCGGQASTENEKFCRFCGAKFPEMNFTADPQDAGQNHPDAENGDNGDNGKNSPFGPGGEAAPGKKDPPDGQQARAEQEEQARGRQETAPSPSGQKKRAAAAGSAEQTGGASAGPRSRRLREWGGMAKWIAIIAAALVLGYAVGLTVWSYMWKYSTSVKVNGEKYSLAETTELRVEQPGPKDWEAIGRLTQVTSLTVVGGPDMPAVTQEDLQNLVYLENLQTLIFDGVTFQCGPELPYMDGLVVLKICHAGLTTNDCDALLLLSSVETLDLSGNQLAGLGFLSRFPNLRELDVTNNAIVQYGALHYVSFLETLAVDQIQPRDLANLQFLKNLTVGGVRIEDIRAFMEGRQGADTPAAAQYETVGYVTVRKGRAENGPAGECSFLGGPGQTAFRDFP